MEVIQAPLESAEVSEVFEVATCVMVFEHILDLQGALNRIRSFLKLGGIFYLIVADRDYYLSPRFGYEIHATDVDPSTVVVRITRPSGTICDLVRPVYVYRSAAEQAGFVVQESIPLLPTVELVGALPKYEPYKETTIAHLLVLKAS